MDASQQSSSTSLTLTQSLLLWLAAIVAAIVMTWPLVTGLGHLGRTQNSGDARFAVWNVAWVAHALSTDPFELFDANIYAPHRHTLAYSEANIGAGTLALPIWIATHNPFTAFNLVVLFTFAASIVATWLLARRLTGDGAAAATAAVLFAFCPYVFSHIAHIQLLMVAGVPLCLLMLHRLVDAPSPSRGLALGAALFVQAMSCAYYGIFAGLTIGYATLFFAASRRLWTWRAYWLAIAIAAVVAVGCVLPFFLPYLDIQRETGFARSLDDARQWSAYWRSYLASSAHAHAWLLPLIREWNGAVLFPGFLGIALAIVGAIGSTRGSKERDEARAHDTETVLLYGSIGLLAFWASLGPRAGLYTVFYTVIPVFSFLRAPERMGIVVILALAVLAAFGVRALRERVAGSSRRAVAIACCALALLELNDLPFDWRPDAIPPVYRALAQMPRGLLVEFPFYDRRIDFHIHSRYMLFSTAHWQPLVNGYSDNIPADFRTLAPVLATFPSRESFDAMRERRVRYLSIHRGRQGYGNETTPEIERRLQPFLQHLRPIADDGQIVIYEVVSWPR
jgi:hypothetical protein